MHVYFSVNQLANEFKGVLDSFGLTHSVNAPTHEQGHTLDLVISLGLSFFVGKKWIPPPQMAFPLSLTFLPLCLSESPFPQLVTNDSLLYQQMESFRLPSGTSSSMLLLSLPCPERYSPLSILLALLSWTQLPLFGKQKHETQS